VAGLVSAISAELPFAQFFNSVCSASDRAPKSASDRPAARFALTWRFLTWRIPPSLIPSAAPAEFICLDTSSKSDSAYDLSQRRPSEGLIAKDR
jgi:hypothetical protein